MPVIEKFMGKQVEIPEDRRYSTRQGLWGKKADGAIRFGLSGPALVLCGGIKDIDFLVPDGSRVAAGDAVAFAITGKILYIEAPVSGTVELNTPLADGPESIAADPYTGGWLFGIRPPEGTDEGYQALASAEEYLESLRGSEGFKNPEGLKGGVSGMCKAVYSGIGEQKI